MAPAATVLIPTHDHGPLLRYSLESALAQTVTDLEILVVGDGVPDVTREIVGELADRDARVRFFDNPKGPRHGEIHRHAALQEASGEIVLYLSDDDLWFPEHVETMANALEYGLDLVSAVSLKTAPGGGFAVRMHDVGRHRDEFLRGESGGIPLSCAAHSLEAYRALPFGWRTTPSGIATDKYMWRQFLADPSCRVGSTTRVTVVGLGSPPRVGMTLEERLAEMAGWAERVGDPVARGELHARACALMVARHDRMRIKERRARAKLVAARAELVAARRSVLKKARDRLLG